MVRKHEVRATLIRVVAGALGIFYIIREEEPGTPCCREAVGLGTSLMCSLFLISR